MAWTVEVHRRVQSRLLTAFAGPVESCRPRAGDRTAGPVRGNWPHYSSLGPGRHHCHLKKGRPTYVAVWEVRDREQRIVEVTYVGTHERAPC